MESTIQHGSFTIERSINAPVEKVYNAFAEKDAKTKWFGIKGGYELDFQVGGKEQGSAVVHEEMSFRYIATYYDIVPNKRIVYAYEMYKNDQRISVSLATIEFAEADGKTLLTLREDGAFLDGTDTVEIRESGTNQIMDLLEKTLQ